MTLPCGHADYNLTHYPILNLDICEDEGGQFVCGYIMNMRGSYPRARCNVCGKNTGNLYCLERHLREESPKCRDEFRLEF